MLMYTKEYTRNYQINKLTILNKNSRFYLLNLNNTIILKLQRKIFTTFRCFYNRKNKIRYFMKTITGIDLGSRFVKIVVFENENLTEKLLFDTVSFYKNYCKIINKKLNLDFKQLNIPHDNICSTGYGRNNIQLSNSLAINELKAHTWGIFYQLNIENFTLLDIGGQDVKIIKVTNGYIDDFIMNDKCAASTGRFFENVAKILDVGLEYLSQQSKNPVTINSTCAIFSETEIIGKIAEGVDLDSICAGINYTIAQRITVMMKNILETPLIVSGGVSKNNSLIYFLKKLLKVDEITKPKEPVFNGAIGCVNYYRKIKKAP